MTRHLAQAPLRRSSAPSRILSAGLATATCIGVVGLLGARTIDANAEAQGTDEAPADTTQFEESLAVDQAPLASAPAASVPTSSQGLTEADLDAYAAALAQEKDRLDAYRAKLVRTAKKLKRQAAAQNEAAAWSTPSSSGSSSWVAKSPSAPASKSSASKPTKKSGGGATSQPAAQAQAPAPQPAAQPAKPAPQPAAAPAQKAAPAPQPAGGGGSSQSTTKSS